MAEQPIAVHHLPATQTGHRDGILDVHDVLISDVDQHVLQGDMSSKLGKPYLSTNESNSQEQLSEIDGLLYGRCNRPFFTIPTTIRHNVVYHVHYLFDTGSLYSFMSIEVSESINTSTLDFDDSLPTPGL